MTRRRTAMCALDLPGQADGRAMLQSDRGDEAQSLFMYQWSAGVVLLAGALASVNECVARFTFTKMRAIDLPVSHVVG